MYAKPNRADPRQPFFRPYQPTLRPRQAWAIVLIGVSGSGKSTVGRLLAAALGASFLEGDAYHTSAAIAKMRAGIPLTDLDRWPWLAKLAGAITSHRRNGRAVVVACSALKRVYRERLDTGSRTKLTFVHLALDPLVVARRLQARRNHFMSRSLLASQLAALEPLESDEVGTTIMDAGTARRTTASIQRWLARPRFGEKVSRLQEKGRPKPPDFSPTDIEIQRLPAPSPSRR